MSRCIVPGLLILIVTANATFAAELTLTSIADPKGDGADGKGNTEDDTWQFWFELAHERGAFRPLDTYSTSVAKKGVKGKITGPIAGSLPNPDDTEGWIFHSDWDGRFEGVWADKKAGCIIVHPYAEKTSHLAVAVTYRIPDNGKYDIAGKLTDLQVQPDVEKHDGIDWSVEVVEDGKVVKKIGNGGPVGDGRGRPESDKFLFSGIEAKKGRLIRLVIHPRKWWGSDLTRIDFFRIEPSKEGK